ncbi:general odorant-binding protein 67-like [Anopheles cruzii]|uniref:general odorant-binding protein 67-like n=1 Tax=Anopheles cruzii TaxID=68878 RepID=UPI0022EC6DDE|nr:general odorant-binding protein 67-like [Anopheles cruzii]
MHPIAGKTLLVLCCSALLSAVVSGAPSSCTKLDLQTDPFSCCTIPKLLDLTVVSKCFEQFPIDAASDSSKGASGIPQTDCMSECILNSTSIYNARGVLNEKTLNSVFIDSLPQNSPWLSVVRGAVKDCLAKSSRQNKDFSKSVADQKKTTGSNGGRVCNPQASFLVDCIHTTVFSNCPTTLRSTTNECATIWTFLQNCPFSALRQ